MKKILIPIEKYQDDYKVIDQAVDIAKKFDSVVTLFHVDDTKRVFKQMQDDTYADVEKIEKSIKKEEGSLENIEKKYSEKGIKTETKDIVGDPASEIVDEAENGDYDLVIMRTHRMETTKRFLLGSVTNKVVHHIKKPILIIR